MGLIQCGADFSVFPFLGILQCGAYFSVGLLSVGLDFSVGLLQCGAYFVWGRPSVWG